MTEAIRVVSTSPATTEWRAEKADGAYLCDIQLQLFVRWSGSRYLVLRNGSLVKEGQFYCKDWDDKTACEVITAIMHSMSPGADVTVGPRRP